MTVENGGGQKVNSVGPDEIEGRDVERRSFLKSAVIGLAGLAAAACTPDNSSDVADDDPTDEADSD